MGQWGLKDPEEEEECVCGGVGWGRLGRFQGSLALKHPLDWLCSPHLTQKKS